MILPPQDERNVLSFLVLPNLGYGPRLALGFGLILLGLVLQGLSGGFVPGAPFLALGVLLLLVRGYHNRVEFGSLDPDQHWERVPMERLDELLEMDKKMLAWDRSFLDISNPLGGTFFFLLAGGLVLGAVLSEGLLRTLFLDGLILFLPQWLTGQRRLLRVPKLLIQVQSLKKVLDLNREALKKHRVHLHMLLRGSRTAIPQDLKIKVDLEGQSKDFLGLYGQVVLNAVQGRFFPYFYVVLVAKKGFGLREGLEESKAVPGITTEFKEQGDVEVLVLRQHTTKTSGYHTKPSAASRIFSLGLALAEKLAPPRVPGLPSTA
ncbi:MAG TPA: hypothetical protein ENK02_02055 [Planctomycetes bacterium]|nr:hypothetical protein [Planctomycetota bacterium]